MPAAASSPPSMPDGHVALIVERRYRLDGIRTSGSHWGYDCPPADGLTALSRAGRAGADLSYAPRFPSCLNQTLVDAPLHLRKTSLFADVGHDPDGVADKGTAGGGGREWWNWSLRLSSPERAILEALDELPDGDGFRSIDMVFQSVVSLRPRRLMTLLTACSSVKVKRLFFVYAERHRHAWFKHLDQAPGSNQHRPRQRRPLTGQGRAAPLDLSHHAAQ